MAILFGWLGALVNNAHFLLVVFQLIWLVVLAADGDFWRVSSS